MTWSVPSPMRVTPAAVTLATSDGPNSVARDRVAEIYRRGDPVVNGIAIGAVTGAILGIWFTKETGCGALLSGYEACSAREYAGKTAAASGRAAGVALGIDALVRGRTRIYPTEKGGFWQMTRVAPQVSPGHAAIVISTRW